MDNNIFLKFVGNELTPEKIDFKKLTGLVEDYFRILVSIVEETQQIKENHDYRYSLMSITPGSISLNFLDKSNAVLQESSYVLADAVSNKSTDKFPFKVRQNISSFAKNLESNEIPLAVSLFSEAGVDVRLDPKDYIVDSIRYQSSETIYGELTDVGGTSPNVHITSTIGLVKCEVTKEQAIQLGSRLYKTVGLLCDVYRSYGNEKPDRLVVTEILPYDEAKWDDNIVDLQMIFSERFKNTDVEDFFRELRS